MDRNLLAGISAIALLASAQAGLAQENEAVVTLERVVVTGTKRAEDRFDVPATVESRSADELTDRGIASLGELDRVFADTSIRTRSSRAYTNVSVRGQSSLDFYNPSVQVYVDGLPQDAATLAQMLPAGLEDVELLYGPQGTLYGRGAIGGVINVTTRKPDDQWHASATGALHTLGGDANFLLSGPLVEGMLYGDAALNFRREDDDYTVLGTGADIGGTDDWNGRLRLRYAPTGSPLDVMVTAQRGQTSSSEEQFVMESMLEDRIALPVPSYYDLDTTRFGVNASYDLGGATVTALTGYVDRDLDRTTFGFYSPETEQTFSQELRIASNPDEGNRIDYVAGIYGQHVDFERRMPSYFLTSQQEISSYAVFGDLTWHATDRLDISPGLRLDYEKVKAETSGAMVLNGEDSFTAISPKLGASFELTETWRLYGLFSTGFKAGGFTRTVTSPNAAFAYDPQHTYNGEVGVKYQSLDGFWESSLAAYYNVTTDYQMFVGPVGMQYLQNVGEVTAKGVNASLRMQPTSAFSATAGLAINRTTFTDYTDPFGTGLDYTGNAVPYAPRFTANLALDYTFDLAEGWGQIIPRVGLSYSGDVFFDESNTIGQDGFALVDLGVSWKVNEHAVADFFVNNVFDETYAVYGFNQAGYGNLYQLGDGRSVGGRLNFTF